MDGYPLKGDDLLVCGGTRPKFCHQGAGSGDARASVDGMNPKGVRQEWK